MHEGVDLYQCRPRRFGLFQGLAAAFALIRLILFPRSAALAATACLLDPLHLRAQLAAPSHPIDPRPVVAIQSQSDVSLAQPPPPVSQDPLDLYAKIIGKTVLMGSAIPRPSNLAPPDSPSGNSKFIAAFESALSSNGISVVQDGPDFVRIVPGNQNMQEFAPLRGAELASSAEKQPHGGEEINFLSIDSTTFLDLYAQVSHRTLLSPSLPPINLRLVSTKPLTQDETLYAMKTVLALNGICVVEDGDKFAQVVTASWRANVKTNAPNHEPDAKLFDPKQIPSTGHRDQNPTASKVEQELARLRMAYYDFMREPDPQKQQAARLLRFYATLADKTAVPSKYFDGRPIRFLVRTPLTKSELLYAIETTFALNEIAIVPAGKGAITLGSARPASASKQH